MKQPFRRWSEFEVAEIIRMLELDMTFKQIGRRFGVSRQALYYLLNRRHIIPSMHRPSWGRMKKP